MQRDIEPTDEQKDKAAFWLAKRAGGSLSEDEKRQLEDWLNAALGNRLAFDQMRILWAQLEAPAKRLAQKSKLPWRRLRSPGWRGSLALLGASCALWAAVWFTSPNILQDWQADIVAGRDIATTATLPDGSTLTLSADTALSTNFEQGRRQVTLLRGQALFDVAHRDTGPFIVNAKEATVRVVGTRFNVDLQPDQTVVSVNRGAVEVTGNADSSPAHLMPGQSVSVRDGHSSAITSANLDRVLSWLNGQISVQNIPVGTLTDQLERYGTGRIVVIGPLASRKISGTFPATDIDRALDTIAAATDSTVLHSTPWLTILF